MAKWRGPFIWNAFQALKSNFSDGYQFGDFYSGYFGFDRNPQEEETYEAGNKILGEVMNNSRAEYLEDRAHTEEREDSAYQRAVADMRKAGLNPYTVGANPAPSSASSVGENSIMTKLQVLGYILDLQNLDTKNRSVTNQLIGNVLRVAARK